MTLAASSVEELGGRLPSNMERSAANQLRQILAAQMSDSRGNQHIKIADEAGSVQDIVLGPALASLLMDVLRHIGKGDAVTLVPVSQKLTTQQAADILNISRPHLISLLEKNALPHVKVGRHRRIEAAELFAYKKKRDGERDAALSELAEMDSELI